MLYVERFEYENRLRKLRNTDDVKVLTGVRRCGKSTLLQWLKGDFLASGVSVANVFYRRMDMFGMPLNPDAEWLLRLPMRFSRLIQTRRFMFCLMRSRTFPDGNELFGSCIRARIPMCTSRGRTPMFCRLILLRLLADAMSS